MVESRSGREAETQSAEDLSDERNESTDGASGTQGAHGLPPNPEPAEGPRDKRFTEDTLPEASGDDQK